MSGKASAVGYHALYERMTPAQRARFMAHIGTTQPAVVNVSGADSYPASLYWAHEILDNCPNTYVFERRVDRPWKGHPKEDDGGIFQFDTDVWWNWRVAPYLDLLKHPRLVVVYDNESNMGDFSPYAAKMVAAMDRGDANDVAVGVGRFSTGTPEPFQYQQLKPMFERLVGSRHWWTPNEYCGPDPQTSSGHLARFVDGLAVLKAADRKKVHVATGEAGLMLRYTRSMDEKAKAFYYLALLEQWYLAHGVPWMVWAVENQDPVWRAQGVGETFYRVIEAQLERTLISWPPAGTGAENQPIPAWTSTRAALRNMGRDKTLFVRAQPTTQSAIVGRIETGKQIRYQWPPVEGQQLVFDGVDLGNAWVPVRVDGVQGYSFAYYLALPEMQIEASAAVVIDEPPIHVEDTTKVAPVEDPTAWLEEDAVDPMEPEWGPDGGPVDYDAIDDYVEDEDDLPDKNAADE